MQCLPVRDETLEEGQKPISTDINMTTMVHYAKHQWSTNKEVVLDMLKSYWPYRDETHEEDGLLFRSNRLIIPHQLKSTILTRLHSAVEKTLHSAKEVLYWPTMHRHIRETVENSSVHKENKPRQQKEPLVNCTNCTMAGCGSRLVSTPRSPLFSVGLLPILL